MERRIDFELVFWGQDIGQALDMARRGEDVRRYWSGIDPVCWIRPDGRLYKNPLPLFLLESAIYNPPEGDDFMDTARLIYCRGAGGVNPPGDQSSYTGNNRQSGCGPAGGKCPCGWTIECATVALLQAGIAKLDMMANFIT